MSEERGSELPEPDFPAPTRAREGYRAADVDAFVTQLRSAVRHRPPSLAPYEVADIEFPVHRRGERYDLRAVDDYLDQAQDVLREVHGEDAVAGLEVRPREPRRHVPTLWIYGGAVVLVVAMLAFAVWWL